MHASFNFLESDSPKQLEKIQPLPAVRPYKPQTRDKPPNMIYTSPKSLAFIKSKDKDAADDFERDSLVTAKKKQKKGRNLKRKLQYSVGP